jgi:thiamine-phosphate diphosphorylase
MNPFVANQVHAVIEEIRLLEAFITAPLGLYSDIKMMRESLPFPDAAELPREELRERRMAFGQITDSPQQLTLDTISSLRASVDILAQVKGDPDIAKLHEGWIPRVRMVLNRSEDQVAAELRAGIASKLRGIYVIVDPEATGDRDVVEIATAALKGGVTVVQFRDKTRDKGEVIPIAREILDLCNQHDALFIMNDDADVAIAAGAHGLHVGQTDLSVGEARKSLELHQIVGRSNNGLEQAMDSQQQGADYLAVGAVYATTTMGKSGRSAVGPETIRKVREAADQPIVAIGGLDESNIVEVVQAGADSICVVSAITMADNPEAAASKLVGLFNSA